eukprot:TRINITY_DN6440_c3_g1_i1.p1 TRINITY_DN6440_c3_g1~~TRINITY_DN6440_c3_g1_i1.p1  ORF type:complete len:366 (+),score=128.48 TRINITY_DN6440_c3_g1_i1:216-1313(+)
MAEDNYDYYEVLGVTPIASVKEITKAYRKKALRYHPDKNPDDAEAARLFEQIRKASEILVDESARKAYDGVMRVKQARKRRDAAMDSKRKRMRDNLFEKEEAHRQQRMEEDQARRRLQVEIERLRKKRKTTPSFDVNESDGGVDGGRDDSTTVTAKYQPGFYNTKRLKKLFANYGDVVSVDATDRKATILFRTVAGAQSALNCDGVPGQKLRVSMKTVSTGNPRRNAVGGPVFATNYGSFPGSVPGNRSHPNPNKGSSTTPVSGGVEPDFEEMVLAKMMRKAQQQKQQKQQQQQKAAATAAATAEGETDAATTTTTATATATATAATWMGGGGGGGGDRRAAERRKLAEAILAEEAEEERRANDA